MQSKILKRVYGSAAALVLSGAMGGCATVYPCDADQLCRSARERQEFMSVTLPMLVDQKTGKIDPDTALLTISYLNEFGNTRERAAVEAVIKAKGVTMDDVTAAANNARAMQKAAENAGKACIEKNENGTYTLIMGACPEVKDALKPTPAR